MNFAILFFSLAQSSTAVSLDCQKGDVNACYQECIQAEPSSCVRFHHWMYVAAQRGFGFEMVCSEQGACRLKKRGVTPQTKRAKYKARRDELAQNKQYYQKLREDRIRQKRWEDLQRDRRLFEGQGYE